MIELLYQQACGLLTLFERLVPHPEMSPADRAAIDAGLDDLMAAARRAEAAYQERAKAVAGCTYKHFYAHGFPYLKYAPIWDSHTHLVNEAVNLKMMVRFRRQAEKNLGFTKRRFWSTPPPFGGNEQPLSKFCARLQAAPETGNRRKAKKYLKNQIRVLQVLIVQIAPLATPRADKDQVTLYKRSAALSVGNAVIHQWKRSS